MMPDSVPTPKHLGRTHRARPRQQNTAMWPPRRADIIRYMYDSPHAPTPDSDTTRLIILKTARPHVAAAREPRECVPG